MRPRVHKEVTVAAREWERMLADIFSVRRYSILLIINTTAYLSNV